jgi:hypothetical protein
MNLGSYSVAAGTTSTPVSALIWWLIPLFALIGALAYVLWLAKFQSKFENETNRSVNNFRRFQDSLAVQQAPIKIITPNEDKSADNATS